MSLSRRELVVAGLGALGLPLQGDGAESDAPIPTVEFGKTGRTLPRLGLGCQAVGELQDHGAGQEVVERAFADGVRYFDTAPAYGWGKSEVRVGRGLARAPRESLWINTKTLARTPEEARKGLGESLGRLKTGYVDSILLHAINTKKSLTEVLISGVPEVLLKAKEEGLVRHIGISGHADPAVIERALKVFGFDLCLVPVNPLDPQLKSFVKGFLPFAKTQGVGVVAMKVLAGGHLPKERASAATVGQLVRYALAQPGVHIAVVGARSLEEWALIRGALADPLPDETASAALEAGIGKHSGKSTEWYKFDQ